MIKSRFDLWHHFMALNKFLPASVNLFLEIQEREREKKWFKNFINFSTLYIYMEKYVWLNNISIKRRNVNEIITHRITDSYHRFCDRRNLYIYIYLEFILTHILFRINRPNICITARFIHTFINTCRTLLSPRFISLTKHHPLYARLTINKTILSIRPYRNF